MWPFSAPLSLVVLFPRKTNLFNENYVMFPDKDRLTNDPCIAPPITQVKDTFASNVTLEQETSAVTMATAYVVPSQSNQTVDTLCFECSSAGQHKHYSTFRVCTDVCRRSYPPRSACVCLTYNKFVRVLLAINCSVFLQHTRPELLEPKNIPLRP